MTRPEICVGAVVVDDDRLLMIRRGHGPAAGEWSIPGGRVERGELMVEAVVREVTEETGLDVVVDDYIGYVERISEDAHFVIHDFHATAFTIEPVIAGDDAAEARWVDLSAVAELNLVEGLAEFLADHHVIPLIT
ncbi:MAG: NUDIX domain-containing protein [Actinobacteria bacterium]|nr:NUDIX domain-containing protein [Actinomycetota bacterium]